MLERQRLARLTAGLAVAGILALGAGCGGGGGSSGGSEAGGGDGETPTEIIGVITEVTRSEGKVTGLALRTEEGETHDIALDPNIDYGFDHELLDDHQQAESLMRVSVETRGNRLVATVILNA